MSDSSCWNLTIICASFQCSNWENCRSVAENQMPTFYWTSWNSRLEFYSDVSSHRSNWFLFLLFPVYVSALNYCYGFQWLINWSKVNREKQAAYLREYARNQYHKNFTDQKADEFRQQKLKCLSNIQHLMVSWYEYDVFFHGMFSYFLVFLGNSSTQADSYPNR